MAEVVIKCLGAATVDIDHLHAFQGNLKDLSEENYEKLKSLILNSGFREPISVWKNPEGVHMVLNGHQRLRVLQKMREEGHVIPMIPVNYVEVEDVRDGKLTVLSLTSQFGEMTKQGLYEFMSEAEISMPEIETNFNFSDINFDKFKSEFFEEKIETQETTETGAAPAEKEYVLVLYAVDEPQLQSLFAEFQERGLRCKLIS